jgi:hypothetical protein
MPPLYWLDVQHRLSASLALRAAMLGPRRVDSFGRRLSTVLSTLGVKGRGTTRGPAFLYCWTSPGLASPLVPRARNAAVHLRFCFVPSSTKALGTSTGRLHFEYRLASSRQPGCTSHTPRAI